jgi:hypothetical protein
METISHDPQDDDSEISEELVAYLDGELSVEHSRRVEERAAVQPDTRRMLEEFDRTWHMLDELETPATGEDFTRTTLEMVALAAANDAAKLNAEVPRARRRARLWTVAGLTAAAVAGFFLVAAFAPDPNAQLLHDLRLLENYDQYRDIGSIEFLRALSADNPFPKDGAAAAPVPIYNAAETFAQRRKLVEAMTPEQRDDLVKVEGTFRGLSDAERQHWRELHAAIESDPERDKLLTLMNRYDEWFVAQPLTVQSEQQQLKPAPRVAALKKALEKGAIAGAEIRLDEKSRLGLARWVDRYTTEHEAAILQEMARARGGMGRPQGGPLHPNPNAGTEGEAAATLAKLQRKRQIVREWLRHSLQSDNAAQHPVISKEEMDSLRASLSSDVRAKLESHKPEEQQRRIIAGWLRETLSPEFDEQLAEFFATTINKEARDRLMALPIDEMYPELRRMYRQSGGGDGLRFGDQRNRRGGRFGPRGSGGRRFMDNQTPREPSATPEPSGGKESVPQGSAGAKPAEK